MLPSILPLPDGLRLLPIPAQEHAEALADDRHVLPSPDPSDGTGAPPRRAGSPRWADVMRRTFGLDVLACPRCGGRLRLIALIAAASVIQRILRQLGLPTEIPEPRSARAPPLPFEAHPRPADNDLAAFDPCSSARVASARRRCVRASVEWGGFP